MSSATLRLLLEESQTQLWFWDKNLFKILYNHQYPPQGREMRAIYGLQRTFYDKLNLSAETGLGFYFTDVQDPQFTVLLNITLGWILF